MTANIKTLEKKTKELLSLISQWEERQGPNGPNGEFRFAGERYVDRVAHQEEHYKVRSNLY